MNVAIIFSREPCLNQIPKIHFLVIGFPYLITLSHISTELTRVTQFVLFNLNLVERNVNFCPGGQSYKLAMRPIQEVSSVYDVTEQTDIKLGS